MDEDKQEESVYTLYQSLKLHPECVAAVSFVDEDLDAKGVDPTDVDTDELEYRMMDAGWNYIEEIARR